MTSSERIHLSLAHQTPDQIPLDFGGTPVTGMHVLIIQKLRDYFGLETHPVRVKEPYQMLGEIEPDLAAILGIDTVGISPEKNMFGISNQNWKEFKTPWDQTVLVPGQFNTSTNARGDIFIYPEGDLSILACAKMPASGFFFDALIRQENIYEEQFDPKDNLEEFSEISQADIDYFKQETDKQKNSGKAIIANFGGTAIGDIALVPAMNLKKPKGIRDVAEWYMSTMTRQDYLHEIFDAQSSIAIHNLEQIFAEIGNSVDVVFICGTDFGTQDSQFCSAETFKNLYAPYYTRMNSWIHEHTTWKTFKHSCGAVEPFIPLFIECGFDIINPVQVGAAGMDPTLLKSRYGNQIVFWGGGIDTQKTLAFGSTKEIEKEVLSHCEVFSKNGGFVFNTIHNVQANVPLQNLIAMLNAFRTFNGQSILKIN